MTFLNCSREKKDHDWSNSDDINVLKFLDLGNSGFGGGRFNHRLYGNKGIDYGEQASCNEIPFSNIWPVLTCFDC